MSHFAQLDENNLVIQVIVCGDDIDGKEQEVSEQTGEVWKQTSYNTLGGKYYVAATGELHADQSKAFRKNFAGVGYRYDPTRDAFIPPQPYPSWVLNDESCLWEPPSPHPNDGQSYAWDENSLSWTLIAQQTVEE